MEMITPKTWEEFRNTGLLWWTNSFLQLFGWSLCYDPETKEMYPARNKFRGFSEEINDDGYKKVTRYLSNHIEELLEECEDAEDSSGDSDIEIDDL